MLKLLFRVSVILGATLVVTLLVGYNLNKANDLSTTNWAVAVTYAVLVGYIISGGSKK